MDIKKLVRKEVLDKLLEAKSYLPKNLTFKISPFATALATRPILTAPAVCELDGPTITGPSILKRPMPILKRNLQSSNSKK